MDKDDRIWRYRTWRETFATIGIPFRLDKMTALTTAETYMSFIILWIDCRIAAKQGGLRHDIDNMLGSNTEDALQDFLVSIEEKTQWNFREAFLLVEIGAYGSVQICIVDVDQLSP